ELNLIELFWSMVKSRVRGHSLNDTETLESRIREASLNIPIEHLRNIIQHSKNRFVGCIEQKPI
ncbi:hypothetical protein BDB01DRAFT_710691, partial [Pilobolus umbonatus]